LDIEHTDGKRYYTWDKSLFPDPKAMQLKLAKHGRKMVTIVDPHIKRDNGYYLHKEAEDGGMYLKNSGGASVFDGWCWPGSSSYPDYTNPKVRDWWASQFAYDKYSGSTKHLFTWNDMNEPSVFNGPEVSMKKDVLNLNGVEHREWHNLYGFFHHWASMRGGKERDVRAAPDAPLSEQLRPFVLTRSYFAGSQRFGAMWTGDNAAQWSHLEIATPMLLTQNIAGMPFSGADVGGFFGNPPVMLLERWYQAAIYQPFFRAHAHIDTKRREPWLFGPKVLSRIRATVMRRYQLLPLIYTAYHDASLSGTPVMAPLWSLFPTDSAVFTMDDQFMLGGFHNGGALLVKPVVTEASASATTAKVYLPLGTWYDVRRTTIEEKRTYGTRYVSNGQQVEVPLDAEEIPVFQHGGVIVPRKMRLRRSSALMHRDPFTLIVSLDVNAQAKGELFLDDEVSQSPLYCRREFKFSTIAGANSLTGPWTITGRSAAGHDGGSGATAEWNPPNTVERIVILGFPVTPSSIVILHGVASQDNVDLTFVFDASAKVLTIRKPNVGIAENFVIRIQTEESSSVTASR
jgi:alpha 1,3-glucosidase